MRGKDDWLPTLTDIELWQGNYYTLVSSNNLWYLATVCVWMNC